MSLCLKYWISCLLKRKRRYSGLKMCLPHGISYKHWIYWCHKPRMLHNDTLKAQVFFLPCRLTLHTLLWWQPQCSDPITAPTYQHRSLSAHCRSRLLSDNSIWSKAAEIEALWPGLPRGRTSVVFPPVPRYTWRRRHTFSFQLYWF
jgi:hypothetical protein